jgi:hypothetical protein
MESASVARELSAHHGRLADGRFAGTVRCRTFRSGPRGFGADQGPTERVRRQCAHADTQAGAVRRYATLAQSYRAQVRKGYSDPAIHFDQLAKQAGQQPDGARAEATTHTQLAQVA